MSSQTMRDETIFERHTWIVFLVVSIIFGLFGVGDIVQGQSADTSIAESITGMPWEELQASSPSHANLIDLVVRAGGAHLIIIALLSGAICLTAFRRGERWAWFALWALPLWTIFVFVLMFTADRQPGFPPPPPMLSAPIFFVITAVPLALSYRKFFRKQSKTQRHVELTPAVD